MNDHLEKTIPEQQPQSGRNFTTPQPSTTAQIPAEPEIPSGQVSPSPGKSGISPPLNVTRRGKIARLPNEIREQLNRRLHNGENFTDVVSTWLAARYAVEAKNMDSKDLLDLDILRKFTTDISSLRRGDHFARRFDLEEKRQENRKIFERARHRQKIARGMVALEEFVEKNPQAKSAYQALREAIITRKTSNPREETH
jgi:hypothetical protein